MNKEPNIFVEVNLRFAAVHQWSACPIPEVSYLRERHRHEFHIKAVKSVTHTDRDVEIIMLKQSIQEFLKKEITFFMGETSCEMLAMQILKKFELHSCTVLEDGENGATVTY